MEVQLASGSGPGKSVAGLPIAMACLGIAERILVTVLYGRPFDPADSFGEPLDIASRARLDPPAPISRATQRPNGANLIKCINCPSIHQFAAFEAREV